MNKTTSGFGANTLTNAGATSVGFKGNNATTATGDNKANPTSHWKSTYNGVVEESLSQQVTRT